MRAENAARIAEAIHAADSIFIAAHENPDGDAVGSLLALRSVLLGLGKRVHAATPTPPPARFHYLEGLEAISTDPPAERPQLGIALDCDGSDRLGALEEALLAAEVVVDVDHHGGPERFGGIQLVDPTATSTTMLVMEIARALGIERPSQAQASALYTGLIADSGCFRFTNTTPEALRLGAELVAAGADPSELARRVFTIRSIEAVLLEGRALSSLEMLDCGVAVAALSP